MDQPFKGGQLVVLFFPVLRPCLRLVPSYLISGVYFNIVVQELLMDLGGEGLDSLTQLLGKMGQFGVLLEQFQQLI